MKCARDVHAVSAHFHAQGRCDPESGGDRLAGQAGCCACCAQRVRPARVPGTPLSLTDAAVDPFPKQVGVAAVAGVLLNHVDQYRAELRVTAIRFEALHA